MRPVIRIATKDDIKKFEENIDDNYEQKLAEMRMHEEEEARKRMYEEVYNFYDEELTKKMRDAGMSDDQIQQAKDERNAVFKDLTDAYQEPLWLLPTMNEDEQDDDEGGDL